MTVLWLNRAILSRISPPQIDLAKSKSEIFENRNCENFRSVEIPKSQERKTRFARSAAIERLLGARSLQTFKPCLKLAGGRARRRCFPFVFRYPPPGLLLTPGTPARPRVFPEASPGEPKGKAATRAMPTYAREAAAVGAEPRRSAQKTRGRAGSPTRATRHTASLQATLNADPALP